MSREPYLVAIDIGSNSIKLAVAKDGLEESSKMQILALIEKASFGIRRGLITNMQEATQSLTEVVTQAESVIGLPIRRAVFSINGMHVGFINCEGLVVVSRSDNEITESDIDRVVNDAILKAYGLNPQEILHVVPKSFSVDNQHGIRYPVGMIGSKLQTHALVITADNSYIRNFTKVINQAGMDVVENIYSPLAACDFVLSSRQKKAGTLVVDIGYSTTSYILCENDEIYASSVIPIGSDHITNDLAVGLGTTMEMAEEVKRQYLDLTDDYDNTISEIEMYNSETRVNECFKMEDVRHIARTRIDEIFTILRSEIKRLDRLGKLPGGVMLIGGGTNLKGIDNIARDVLKLPIFKYHFDNSKIDFIPDYNGDPAFINAISLLHYTMSHNSDNNKTLTRRKAVASAPTNINTKQQSSGEVNDIFKKLWPW